MRKNYVIQALGIEYFNGQNIKQHLLETYFSYAESTPCYDFIPLDIET
jgi:hypothetical protein